MDRDQAIRILNDLRPALQARGVAHAGLFGSVARGESDAGSDVDVVISFAPGARVGGFNLGGVQLELEEAFRKPIDLVVEPVGDQRLRDAIERDRAHAF